MAKKISQPKKKPSAAPREWIMAAARGESDKLSQMLRAGQEVDAVDDAGMTALMWSVYSERLDCVNLLVAVGADLDAKEEDGCTATMLAAGLGHAECLSCLVDAGCRIDERVADGRSALDFAAAKGSAECMEILRRAAAFREGRAIAAAIGSEARSSKGRPLWL